MVINLPSKLGVFTVIVRSLSTSLRGNAIAKDQTPKQAKVLQKLLSRYEKRKKGPTSVSTTPIKDIGNSKRVAVLNNLFMEYITDVMATGEIGSELEGYGIEITRMKVAPNFGTVKVFWTLPHYNFNQSEKVQKLLNSNAGKIRSEMIRQHLLGIMPLINFVQDKATEKVTEVERLLAIADFGPDEDESLQTAEQLEEKDDDDLHTEPSEVIDCDAEEILSERPRTWQEYPEDMKTNIFGLDHNLIMKQVMQKMIKRKPYYTPVMEQNEDKPSRIDQFLSDYRKVLARKQDKTRLDKTKDCEIISYEYVNPPSYDESELREEKDYYDESDDDIDYTGVNRDK